MDPVPHEGKGSGEEEEGGANAAVVVEMLNGVHAQPSERLNVRVAMVQRVDVLVESLDVDEPVATEYYSGSFLGVFFKLL